jgi:hypothetical protein
MLPPPGKDGARPHRALSAFRFVIDWLGINYPAYHRGFMASQGA